MKNENCFETFSGTDPFTGFPMTGSTRCSSGNPNFDDNAVRAVLQASPLPAPPASGDWPVLFNPTD